MSGLPDLIGVVAITLPVLALVSWATAYAKRARRVPDGLAEVAPRPLGAARATHGHMLPTVNVTRSMAGARDGVPVRIDEVGDGRARTVVLEVGRVNAKVALRRQSLADDLVDGPDYQLHVGDAPFDRAVLVRGDEVALRALLDADTRALVREATRRGLHVGDGAIVWVVSGGRVLTEALAEHFDRARDLAARLSVPEEQWNERLADIASTDPVAAIRLGALACLTTRDLPRARALAATLAVEPRWVVDVARGLAAQHADTRERLTDPVRRAFPFALDAVDAALARLDAGLALETAGRVSVAEGAGGEVALAQEAGAVSVAAPVAEEEGA